MQNVYRYSYVVIERAKYAHYVIQVIAIKQHTSSVTNSLSSLTTKVKSVCLFGWPAVFRHVTADQSNEKRHQQQIKEVTML